MSIDVRTEKGSILVIADQRQMRDAREAGMARILRLLRYDVLADRYWVSGMDLAKDGIPANLISAVKAHHHP